MLEFIAVFFGLLASVLAWHCWRMQRELSAIRVGLDGMPGAFALWGANDRLIASNRHYRDLHRQAIEKLGERCSYADMIREEMRTRYAGPELDAIVDERVNAQRDGDASFNDREYADGTWLRVTKNRMPDGSIAGFGADITELKRKERELEIAHRVAGLGFWRLDGDDQFVFGGEIMALVGLEPDAKPLGVTDLWRHAGEDDRAGLLDRLAQARLDGKPSTTTIEIAHPVKGQRHLELTMFPDAHGAGKTLYGVVQDMSAHMEHALSLEKLAYYDPLTGLPNRALFQRETNRRLRYCGSEASAFVMVLIDLDHFKKVNDTLGHDTGDSLLVSAGQRMMACLRPQDFLARLGGDEFAILLGDAISPDQVDMVCERLQQAICKPFMLSDREVNVSLSMGIAAAPQDGQDIETLLRNADLALYRVKEAGRQSHRFFDIAMYQSTRKRHDMAKALREAIAGDELSLHYQPQLELNSGRVVGFEALLRWHNAKLGWVSPADFIPVAESSSLISELGIWVLRRACADAASWPGLGMGALSVSVNVSAVQFWQLNMLEEVELALERSGLPAELLCVELNESLFLDRGRDHAAHTLTQLDQIGIRLAIDDFGTGYSSLAYLRDLPFDELKIDRAFIMAGATDPKQRALLNGMIQLGHGLGMAMVAEGVETREQADIVRQLGCEYAQGHYFATPIANQALPAELSRIAARAFMSEPATRETSLVG